MNRDSTGECCLRRYTLQDVPAGVAGDLIGQSELCQCGRTITLQGSVSVYPTFNS